jgi:hypothetical protein
MGLLHRLHTNIVVMGDLNTRMNLCGDGYNPAGRFLENALKNSSYFERLSANEPTYRNQSVLDHTIISKNLNGIVQQHRSAVSSLAGIPGLFDSELQRIKRLRNAAYRRSNWVEVDSLRREFQKLFRRRCRLSWKKFLLEVQQHNNGTI